MSVRPTPKPLSESAAAVFRILLELEPFEALTCPRLFQRLDREREALISEAGFRRHLLPSLREWGVRNAPRRGYFIDPAACPVDLDALRIRHGQRKGQSAPCAT